MDQEKYCIFNISNDYESPLISECTCCKMELVWDSMGGPEESGYKYCPGCGAKIIRFVVMEN